MGSERFLKAQVGLQTAHGTAVTPTVQFPGQGDYEDTREIHTAPYDAGTWTPTTIAAEVGQSTKLTTTGTLFYETLPIHLNSGLADVEPVGADPYTHTYTVSPAAVGVPKPTTWLVGAVGENIGATGPAVKLKDLYLESITLAGGVNDKVVTCKGSWFGTTYDDNAGAGYAFASVALPTALDSVKALLGTINIQDATTTGGDFLTMTSFACAVLDWTWTLNTGLAPKWCLTDNATVMAGVKNEPPSCELKLTARTTQTNYGLIKTKHTARTYQELQIVLAGALTRALTINMTGRSTDVPTAHGRKDNEVVMEATFRCETPHTQVTTPHWLTVVNICKLNWT